MVWEEQSNHTLNLRRHGYKAVMIMRILHTECCDPASNMSKALMLEDPHDAESLMYVRATFFSGWISWFHLVDPESRDMDQRIMSLIFVNEICNLPQKSHTDGIWDLVEL